MKRKLHWNIDDFDGWAATYDRSPMQRWYFGPIQAVMLDLVARHLSPSPKRTLDIGCGTGLLLRAAAEKWPSANLVGVDPAENMVAEARRLTPGATIYLASAEGLPLPDGTVDLAMSSLSFHHWSDPELGLREIRRVLRPGGLFCLADHTMPLWIAGLLKSRARTQRGLVAILKEADLTVIHCKRSWLRSVVIILARKD